MAALLEAASPGDDMLRMVCTRGGNRIITVEPLPAVPETLALVSVRYAPTRVMDGIKSLSYGANMLVSRLAKEQGGDEALLVTPHGRVLEGSRQSFVASLDGETLVTLLHPVGVTGERAHAVPLFERLPDDGATSPAGRADDQ